MSDSPAVVLVTTSFPLRGDGSEAAGSFVSDLASELGRHVPVRVVAPGPMVSRECREHGVEIFRYAATTRPLSTLRPWVVRELIEIRAVLASGEARTLDALRAGPTAHLLALWALPSGHWARRAGRQSGVPYSIWTLGSDIWTLGKMPFVRGLLRRVLRDAQRVYSDGYGLAEATARLARREVRFLPSARNIAKMREARLRTRPPYRLLFLGRWHRNKGVDLLLESLHLLSDEDWQFIEVVSVCGGGLMEDAVGAQLVSLQRNGRPARLGGYLSKESAEEAILQSDFVLIPSRVESIPLIFSDAMKLSAPVICTPVGDLPTLVEKFECGEVARDVSASAFAAAIRLAVRSSPAHYGNAVSRAAALFDLQRGVAAPLLEAMFEIPPRR